MVENDERNTPAANRQVPRCYASLAAMVQTSVVAYSNAASWSERSKLASVDSTPMREPGGSPTQQRARAAMTGEARQRTDSVTNRNNGQQRDQPVKVIQTQMSVSWQVVSDDYGETRTDDKGRAYVYNPLPFCRVPVGHGRTDEQAFEMANEICSLLNERYRTTASVHDVDGVLDDSKP